MADYISIYNHIGQHYYTYMYMLTVIYCGGNNELIIISTSFHKKHIVSQSLEISTANMHDGFEHLSIHTCLFAIPVMILDGTCFT